MEATTSKRLFWFLKDGIRLDLSKEAHRDMYIQQVLSRGRASDIRELFRIVEPVDFRDSFTRIKRFLPREVQMFWEEWLGNINQPAKKGPSSL